MKNELNHSPILKKYLLALAFMALVYNHTFCQGKESTFSPEIRGAIMMANSHVPHATIGGKEVIVIPTWGGDLDYIFKPRWGLTFQVDIELQSFEVKDGESKLERSYPTALALALHYYALEHWSFYIAPGYEIEGHESLLLARIGSEYSFEISEQFEIALNLSYEQKQDVYDTWTFGIAFNKILWKKS